MAKKQHCIIIDTESTIDNKVADFAAVIVDRKGNILNKCAVLVRGIYDNRNISPLFHNENIGELWKARNLDKRYSHYDRMLESGTRMLASINAINRWLDTAAKEYSPLYLTAYNLPYDVNLCQKTAIDLTMFPYRFCLWSAAFNKWAKSRKYRKFIVDNHGFNSPTELGNMSYKTNAEIMARFVLENNELPDEPHTALEDIIGYELPILTKLLKTEKFSSLLELEPYNWRKLQVRDNFKPK